MADDTEHTPPVNPGAAHAERVRRQRAEQQRQQRLLNIDESIAETQGRVQQQRARLEAAEKHLATLEAERADLVALAPDGEVEP